MKRFKKNCRIENAIALRRYSKKLRGDTAGNVPIYDSRPPNDDKLFKIKTQINHRPYVLEKEFFKDTVFIAECPKDSQPFDFKKEYCKPGSEWPNCILTEAAFQFHQLNDKSDREPLKLGVNGMMGNG
uniref:Uncharacterized protein n=1 Tax=Panagrolaimus sp. ES5 TaxID=591445 RepID=A0AC34F9T6_9BILA